MNQSLAAVALVTCVLLFAMPARADFWGGDDMILTQILAETIEQVAEVEQILGTTNDSYHFLQDINAGARNALQISNTMNQALHPGNLSNLHDANSLLHEIEGIYGEIPKTAESTIQSTNDVSIAESLQLHNDAFQYADQVDPQAQRIIDYAQGASPQGAAKTSLEAEGAMIHVLNQILRTDAAILKIQSESLSMENHKSKVQSEAFRSTYGELETSLSGNKPGFDLPSLSQTPSLK